jgi:hypothetical protein
VVALLHAVEAAVDALYMEHAAHVRVRRGPVNAYRGGTVSMAPLFTLQHILRTYCMLYVLALNVRTCCT